ncbi:polyhomeotic-like protein 2, partial [Gastrophryne carolinensis]
MESEAPGSTPSTNRQAVQVIQQALGRQSGSAAQYLQQMYAAQQQHLMLQSTALQQQGSSAQQQIIQRPQSSAPSSGISQQAVLLGNASSPALTANQAQMYLRAQMLIFTPTATMNSVQSDVSSQAPPISTQDHLQKLCHPARTPVLPATPANHIDQRLEATPSDHTGQCLEATPPDHTVQRHTPTPH